MKYCAVRSAITFGTTMSHTSSLSVGHRNPCDALSPMNRLVIMKKLTNPGGLVFAMPCRNPTARVAHALARATLWPCVVNERISLHANQLLARDLFGGKKKKSVSRDRVSREYLRADNRQTVARTRASTVHL